MVQDNIITTQSKCPDDKSCMWLGSMSLGAKNKGRGNRGRGNRGRGRGNRGRGNRGRGNRGRGNRGNRGRGNSSNSNTSTKSPIPYKPKKNVKWYDNKMKNPKKHDSSKIAPLDKNTVIDRQKLLDKIKDLEGKVTKKHKPSKNKSGKSKTKKQNNLKDYQNSNNSNSDNNNMIAKEKMKKRLLQISNVYKKMASQLDYNKYNKNIFNKNFYVLLKKKTNVDIDNFKKVKKNSYKK